MSEEDEDGEEDRGGKVNNNEKWLNTKRASAAWISFSSSLSSSSKCLNLRFPGSPDTFAFPADALLFGCAATCFGGVS
eukprot:5018661-Pyramimonas_sp.AAC.1